MTFTCPKCGAGIDIGGAPLPFTGPCKSCGIVSTWENPENQTAPARPSSPPSAIPAPVKTAAAGGIVVAILAVLVFGGFVLFMLTRSGGPLSNECWFCKGTGKSDCLSCENGTQDCIACVGGRTSEGGTCGFCSGRGSKPCTSCDQKGYTPCMSCNGSGKNK